MANKWGEKCKQWQILYSWAPKSLKMVTAAMNLKDTCFLEEKQWQTFVVVQPLSHCCLFATPWSRAFQASLYFTISWSLLKLMSIDSVMPSNHLVLCHPLYFLPSVFPSIRLSQFFVSGGQNIGASALGSVLPMNIQDWFPLGLTGLISLLSKGLSRVFSNSTVGKHQLLGVQPSLWSTSHIHTWLPEKPYLWLDGPSMGK